MKMLVIFVALAVVFSLSSVCSADVLEDDQLAAIYAGEDTAINDDIVAESSAVANQKNIAVIGSTNSSVSNSSINNMNSALVNNLGDSAVAIQTNIAAIALGGGTSDGNEIANSNDAEVNNGIIQSGVVDALSDGSTQSGAGSNSALVAVSALQSAVASQSNIAAVAGSGTVTGTSLSNVNTATVNNGPAL